MPKKPDEREAPITDARGVIADDLTDHEGRKVRDLDRVGAMTPDTDSEQGAKQQKNRDVETDDAPDAEDDDDRPDDQPR